jgi:hypothetical protein
MLEKLMAVLLSFPVHHTDRTEAAERRTERIRLIAAAIVQTTNDPAMQAALASVAVHESGLAGYVQNGRCSEGPHNCDKGKARGPWQVWSWCKAQDLDGEAACAKRLLAFSFKRCGSYEKAFGSYGSGGTCTAMPEREATRIRVLRGLTRR